jgi:hypothetical protein
MAPLQLRSTSAGIARMLAPALLVEALAIWQAGLTPDYRLTGFGWFIVGLGVASGVATLAQFVKPTTMTVDQKGFTTGVLGVKRHYAWADIADLGLMPANRGVVERVGYSFKDGRGPARQWFWAFNRPLTGYQRYLPIGLGMPAQELLENLRRYRAASADPGP